MHSDIVEVGADGICEACATLTEVFLLVEDEVLGASDNASSLDTLDRLGDCNSGQDWIRCKTLPVT